MKKEEISKEIKLERAKQDITQEELAKKAGIALATLSLIEQGKSKSHPKTILRIANALGVDPKEWID